MNTPQTPTAEPLAPLTGSALVEYLKALKPGERVVETGRSCLQGREGTVYLGKQGEVCVLWDKKRGEDGQMGTSVTGGTRRVTEAQNSDYPTQKGRC